MAFSPDGKLGWAVGRGLALRLQDNEWVSDVKAGPRFTYPGAVLVSPTGDVWVTDIQNLHLFRRGQWEQWFITEQELPDPRQWPRHSLHRAPNSDAVWVVSPDGSVLLFQNGHFEERKTHAAADIKLVSTWLDTTGANGWAISSEDSHPGLIHFDGTQWTHQGVAAEVVPIRLNRLAMTPSGQAGAAVGEGGAVVEFQNGLWKANRAASSLTTKTLHDVWISADGDRGWAIGDGGTVLSKLASKEWQIASEASALTDTDLKYIWLTPDGSLGWIVDKTGSPVLVLQSNHWKTVRDPLVLTTDGFVKVGCGRKLSWALTNSGNLYFDRDEKWTKDRASLGAPNQNPPDVWLDDHGSQGWAIGKGGRLLRLANRKWVPELAANSLTRKPLLALAFSRDGNSGWAVGEEGTALRYQNGIWQTAPGPAQLTNSNLHRIWLAPNGRTGWAQGSKVFRIENESWRSEVDLEYASTVSTSDEQPHALRPSAWAAGFLDQVYRYESAGWKRDSQASGLGVSGVGAWLSDDATTGWIVGRGGFLLLQNGLWLADPQPASLSQAVFRSVCLNDDQLTGWAVGDSGTILRYSANLIAGATLRSDSGDMLSSLTGSWRLTFENDIKSISNVVLVEEQRITPLAPDFRIRPTASPREVLLMIDAPNLAERLRGSRQSLQFDAELAHPSLPIRAVFRSDSFYVKGRPIWQLAAFGILTLLGVNLFLVVLAIRVRWVRWMILHPSGSLVVGLGLGKYLLIDWVIRFVKPIKLAMFSGYRSRLAKSAAIAGWRTERRYIPPQISLDGAALPVTTASSEQLLPDVSWRQIFSQLLTEPQRRLWLIAGPSGLGKTALLENWTSLALELKRTPILIRLRVKGSPQEEVAALLAQYGDIDVKPEVAIDLIKGGGFVILLDAFNEDRNPEATHGFVRQAVQRNLVVMTSQYDPPWKDEVDSERILLEPFGKPQLTELFGEDRVHEILDHPMLSGMVQLPYTAQLVAGFLKRHGHLPATELDLYRDLLAGLGHSPLLNLEEAAWQRFKDNEAELKPTGGIPSEFCESAVEAGVLSRRMRGEETSYRFAHERIHRFLVASWLDRQERKALIEWYKNLQPGLGRGYLGDVLDFWGQMWARRALQSQGAEAPKYVDFMKEVADFKLAIFAQRLYPYYDRLRNSELLPADPSFTAWAARELARAVPEDAA